MAAIIPHMSEALLSGLIGAILGACATALGAWLVAERQIKAQDRAREQETLRTIVADLIAASDRLWRATQTLGYAVYEMVGSKGDPPARAQADEKRQQAFAELRPARHEAAHAVALLRILYPALTQPAQTLATASESFMVGELKGKSMDDYITEREAALTAFEDAARAALRPA